MSLRIGYYVHHHGTGHLSRALAIARHIPGMTLLGTDLTGRCEDVPHIELADDKMPAGRCPASAEIEDVPRSLHYAPLNHDGIRRRAAQLIQWIATERPDLLVVDVSVEIAMLARLASTPVLYIRLAGDRNDAAHLEAFRNARALAAPFHRALDNPKIAQWVQDKTQYFPGLTSATPEQTPQPKTVLVVLGTGGTAITGSDVATAAAATPQLQWQVIGAMPPVANAPANLKLLGWVADAAAQIVGAEIVIGAAGDGVVNSVIAAGRPFICLPQPRPYDEQFSKARRLTAVGAAVTLDRWPAGLAWPGIIAQARSLKPTALGSLHDGQGLQRIAEFITRLAGFT